MPMTAELVQTRIHAGVWEGVLRGVLDLPRLLVLHLETPVPGVDATPIAGRPGDWAVRVPIPAETVSEGTQTYLILDADTKTRLGAFTIVAGATDAEDLRAEVQLLRAELDLLKRAFRRHCVETAPSD